MPAPSLCLFAAEPLDRCSDARADPDWIAARLADPESLLLPLYKGDPLVSGDAPVWLATAARAEFPADAPVVFLGVARGRAHFALDASAAPSPESAPFAGIGRYAPLREAAGFFSDDALAVAGQARWLLDWHRRHRFCAVCGAPTDMADGGAKRRCASCGAEHFPRSDPVAIVLAAHGDACLLGRSPHFPPGFLSALAGFVEAAETPEACAARELKEEAGVTLTDVRYQFSQPWPFPSSLMMGFIATAADRSLTLDRREIEEARWLTRDEIRALLAGERREDARLPPRFTIARRLIERWAESL
ncbi:NAD(+) diphosphatase [Amphiplicatus metriothermophilus]|nr:NAD(+) diphosphatase [Amphiplicatus metriothermophilus]MBB5517456.1 NAD+ diphosphatase [Amphiplicatus metriothermophilus]